MDEIFNFAKERMNAYSRRFGDVDIVPTKNVVHCVNTCYGSCVGTCRRSCTTGCYVSCSDFCKDSCVHSCTWSCHSSCKGAIAGISYDPVRSYYNDQKKK